MIKSANYKLFIDGASRGNPGKSGAGVHLSLNDEIILNKGFFLGTQTNNSAEYLALVIGAFFIKKHGAEDVKVQVYSDSQLLVKQMQGLYKVKMPHILKLKMLARELFGNNQFRFTHILRDKNKVADKLANEGIDFKGQLPVQFVNLAEKHGIKVL